MTVKQQSRLRSLLTALARARQAEEQIIKAVELVALGYDLDNDNDREAAKARQLLITAGADLEFYADKCKIDRQTRTTKRSK